jgi:two-component system, NarL family, sensor histidine kinase UhpB
MRMPRVETLPLPQAHERPWRDAAAVTVITALGFALSAHFQATEWLYATTRHWEYFQVDELPAGMLVLSAGLIWLSWRRYRHARRELQARRTAEARLAEALVENRTLAQESLRIQEVERKHLARDLHDELGQYLNVIKLDAVSIGDSGGTDAQLSVGASQAIIRAVDHVHRIVSDMIGRLRPVGLDELGLASAIEHCVDHWRQRIPETRFQLSVSGEIDHLPESLTLTTYRLIQEGLTNIHKHARAKRAEISLRRVASAGPGADELHVTVTDDGCGMDSNIRVAGFGLNGMRERVEMTGGTFAISSAPGIGLKFDACLPVIRGPE